MIWIQLTPRDAPLPDVKVWVNLERVTHLFRSVQHTRVYFSGRAGDQIDVEETADEILALARTGDRQRPSGDVTVFGGRRFLDAYSAEGGKATTETREP